MQQLTLFTSQSTDTQHGWTMVSDQVMGGVSQGKMQTTENGVNLQGRVKALKIMAVFYKSNGKYQIQSTRPTYKTTKVFLLSGFLNKMKT